jgi:hypothetical protein
VADSAWLLTSSLRAAFASTRVRSFSASSRSDLLLSSRALLSASSSAAARGAGLGGGAGSGGDGSCCSAAASSPPAAAAAAAAPAPPCRPSVQQQHQRADPHSGGSGSSSSSECCLLLELAWSLDPRCPSTGACALPPGAVQVPLCCQGRNSVCRLLLRSLRSAAAKAKAEAEAGAGRREAVIHAFCTCWAAAGPAPRRSHPGRRSQVASEGKVIS